MKKIICLLTCIIISLAVFSQEEISIGRKYSLASAVLQEKREFWVYLPPDYNNTTFAPARYPVVYLLDGDMNFHSFTGMQRLLSEGPYASIPPMIVVGILNTNRTRDLTPSAGGRKAFFSKDSTLFNDGGGNGKFITFLEKELRPYIDSAYRTSGYNILDGHSFGGLTAVNILLHHTGLFNAYIIIDPSLWWANQLMLQQAGGLFPGKDFMKRSIYVAMAHKNRVPQDTTTDHPAAIRYFEKQLHTLHPRGLRWKFHYYPSEDHGTVRLPAAFDGLKFIFEGHQVQVKQVVEEPWRIEDQFHKLSQQLGFTFHPGESYLDWLGNYCLRINRIDNAMAILKSGIAIYPYSAHAYESMAKAYEAKGDLQQAKVYREKAMQLTMK